MLNHCPGSRELGFALGVAALLTGCANSNQPTHLAGERAPGAPTAQVTGRIAITLVNEGVRAGVAGVTLPITAVEVRGPGQAWLTVPLNAGVSAGEKAAALMAEFSEPLIRDAPLPEGIYREVRFQVGAGSDFTDERGVHHPLKTPTALHCGDAELKVERDTLAQHAFLISAAHAIRETPPGSGQFTLEAHDLEARDLAATGFIFGKLKVEASNAPLAGATVTAQTPASDSGPGQVLRTATTRADGSYTLDLLPRGSAFRVLAQTGPGQPPHTPVLSPSLTLPSSGLASQVQHLLATPQSQSQYGRVVVARFPGGDPAHNRSELNLRCLWPMDVGQAPLELIMAQRRITGPGPFELGPIPAGTYTLGYQRQDRQTKSRPSIGPGGSGDLLVRPVVVPAGGTVRVD